MREIRGIYTSLNLGDFDREILPVNVIRISVYEDGFFEVLGNSMLLLIALYLLTEEVLLYYVVTNASTSIFLLLSIIFYLAITSSG